MKTSVPAPEGRLVGYARVSTDEQHLGLQLQALRQAGCGTIYKDHGVSGATMRREGLGRLLQSLRQGDKLIVWRLDRLGRSLGGLISLIEQLGRRGVRFSSLCEQIDIDSPSGKLVFHMMAALAEFERALIGERTRAGMAAARARGTRLGRPPSLSPPQCREARTMIEAGHPPVQVAAHYGVSPRTLKRLLETTAQHGR
jgi:DNA invertase Pin-like site-specific DNA recombinase